VISVFQTPIWYRQDTGSLLFYRSMF